MTIYRNNLKAVRVNAGMNQQHWAECTEVDRGTVFNWENGKSEPNATQSRKIKKLIY